MVNQFRPISLCNVVYKIISKILAARLKPLLHKLIYPLQAAFVPNRTIQENDILVHEIFHTMKEKQGRGGLMAIKIDMEKAYDKMSCPRPNGRAYFITLYFILRVMECFGFSPQWIQWISQCMSTVSYSIMLNGSPYGFFVPSRGLRQGDPLSPFLFIIGMEVLTRIIMRE